VRGYLSHIAARVSGTLPSVRPRVPSLFEPAKGVASLRIPFLTSEHRGPDVEQGLKVAEEVRAAPLVSEISTQQAEGRKTQPHARIAEPSEERIEQQGVRVISRRAGHVEKSATPREEQISTVRPVHERSEVELLESSAVIRPQIRAVQQQGRTQEFPATKEASKEEPGSRAHRYREPAGITESQPSRVSAESADSRSERERVRPSSDRSAVVPAAAANATSPTAQVIQTAPAQRAVLTQEKIIEDAPSVQVTIGRVIVEAIMPAAPAPAPAPRHAPGPRLSLDEYLRQRGGHA
jgi:hypothetical protein